MNRWERIANLNQRRCTMPAIVFEDSYIYVFGGFNVNHLDSIERYDVVYDKWKLLNVKMKRPLQNATAVDIDNKKFC